MYIYSHAGKKRGQQKTLLQSCLDHVVDTHVVFAFEFAFIQNGCFREDLSNSGFSLVVSSTFECPPVHSMYSKASFKILSEK